MCSKAVRFQGSLKRPLSAPLRTREVHVALIAGETQGGHRAAGHEPEGGV